MDSTEEYRLLAELEKETSRTRHTTFTALVSVSFALPSLAVGATEADMAPLFDVLGVPVAFSQGVFFLGYVFYVFAVFHYCWHHRYSHRYRHSLKQLETKLGIEVYRLRVRPRIGRMKLHFDWALYLIALLYGGITALFVGWVVFALGIGSMVVGYGVLMLWSVFWSDEPLEGA
jgi:hypothetical protein